MMHGTRSNYVKGCRCPLCKEANAKYRAGARARAAAGDTADLRSQRPDHVPSTRAREHLLKLKASGFSMTAVAKALEGEVSYHTILKVYRGQAESIAIKTEDAILDVVC